MLGTSNAIDRLIGRDADLARVEAALAGHRLVTLTGPGGSGKTRLARAALATLGGATAFADASALREASLLAPTILAAIAAEPDAAVDPIAAISGQLGTTPATIAVDNLEQLDGAGQVLAGILGAVPSLTILATSRLPLGLPGELEIAVPPLAVPGSDEPAAVEAAPASELFLARARTVGRLGHLDERDAAAIAALCRRLDGLPLAIELAAARTRILSPAEILERIGRLGISAIDAADGRRSMSAILEWTIGLLDPIQRDTLVAAAECEGFDLDFLEAVRPGQDTSGALEDIVSMGLVSYVGAIGGRTRFRLLETIREHVREQVSPRPGPYRAAHAQAMVDRADALWEAADGGEHDQVARMDLEIDNVRRAMAYAAETEPDLGLRLWRRLHPMWSNGRMPEAIETFNRLTALERPPTIELVRTLPDLGRYVALVDGPEAGRAIRRRSAELADVVGDPVARASALSGLAEDALVAGDIAEAERVAAQLADLLEVDDIEARLHAGEALGIAYLTIDGPTSQRALDLFGRLVETALEEKRLHMAASWLGNVAFLHLCRGEYEAAITTGVTFRGVAAGVDPNYLLIGLAYHAIALAAVGRVDDAVAALVDALATEPAQGDSPFAADLLRAAAAIEVARGRPLVAARLAGAAQHRSVETGDVLDPGDALLLERTMAAIRRASRELDVELALRDGAGEDALDLVRQLPQALHDSTPGGQRAGGAAAPTSPSLRHGELTKREIEILGLVGQGMSDPDIGAALFISPKTASVHVANIKGKLGVQSRVEMALRARDLGVA